MAESAACAAHTSSSTTVVEAETTARSPTVVLKLKKPSKHREVKWEEGTIDNENMNKKKSKCCCIYEKPAVFGEWSTDESEDEHDCSHHCRGHKKKDFKQLPEDSSADGGKDEPAPPPPTS